MIKFKNSLNPGLYRINDVDCPTDVLHIFAENRSADQHNSVMLNEIS